ncbi:MAG: hypothetical protein EGR70_04550 [[Ruminococcus] faecis]|nr:hypothetical protein [Mediterraneibacter faecis]
MAKAKSKKITLEEALVPVEEQPYEVPENWCWVKLSYIADIRTGRKDANYGNEDGEYYFFTCASEPIRCDDYSYDCKAILLAGNGDIGNISIYEGKFEAYQRTYIVETKENIITEYLYYYFKYRWVDYNNDKMFGTAIPYIRLGNLNEFEIPVPPLSEQQRIVEQIESLFAKLDEAKEKALSVVESFELREKAIYKKAFEGDLTNSWRAENGINISEWEEIPFEKLGKLERGRSKHRPRNDKRLFGGKYPFIQTGDVAGAGMYVTSHKQTLSEFGFEQSRMFPKGTLCITIAANIGDAAILSYDCCFPDSVVGFTPGEKCLNKYMYFYLQEIKAELEYIAPATAQKNLNLKLLGKVEIKVPSLKEQEKIVEILEKQINDQENIVEKAENVIETIDVMKKSILAKAFRGELGTNIETEESAIELLKSIF